MDEKKLTVEYVAIENLRPFEGNPRKNDESVDSIVKSIESFGFTNPILARRENGEIIAGHTRLLAMKQLGHKTVPVVYLDLDETDAHVYAVFDNKSVENTDWDGLKLAELFAELDQLNVDLTLTGFDTSEIEDIVIGPTGTEGLTDEDDVPDVPENPTAKTGDVWLLGEHRVMCGDSTKKEDVGRLMGAEKADMVFTDPPYNVDYGVSKKPRHKIRTIVGDKQTPAEWALFCKAIFRTFKDYNKGDVYVWGASAPDGMKMRLLLTEIGCHWSATIIWKKQQLVLSPANYQRIYEPCFYGWFEKSSFVADRKQTEVWEIDRPLNSKLHPTMKPVELCAKGIGNSSKTNDIILDLFLGSGSTLIACEKLNRKCYGMEIDPIYIDVIIKRWEDYTGKKAELAT